jgi:hypothetical protein
MLFLEIIVPFIPNVLALIIVEELITDYVKKMVPVNVTLDID